MNDQTEIAHAAQLLTEELDSRGSGNPPIPAHEMAREVLGALHTFVAVYAVYFCADGDLLSRWRGYTGNGGRYALGFTSESLSTDVSRCDLARVEYDGSAQRQGIVDLLDV